MPIGLERRYNRNQLHFITCSCFDSQPLLGTPSRRTTFLEILNSVRDRYRFKVVGYVVMPEHFHLLMSEPARGTHSTALQVLKQRVSRAVRGPSRTGKARPSFWETRFYDFNVWSEDKRAEKLNYMHNNPVKRGLVAEPKLWEWSSARYYESGEPGICKPDETFP